MSGTKEGGKRASQTNRAKHGSEFYREIGRLGGQKKNPNKGFGSKTPEERREAGRKGGTISRRPSKKSIDFSMDYEDIHSKPDTKKRVYGPVNSGLDSNSVSNSGGVLRRTFNRLVK